MNPQLRSLLLGLVAVVSGAMTQTTTADDAPASLKLIDGDRVVLLGGTFIERAQRYGWLEAAIQVRFPGQKIHVRNLGWSADTVFAESRGIFESPSKGYQQMIAQVRDLKPTVILLHYGSNEAFRGTAFLETYLKQYEQLLDDLAPTNSHLVLLSPLVGSLDSSSTTNQETRALPVFELHSPTEHSQRLVPLRRVLSAFQNVDKCWTNL